MVKSKSILIGILLIIVCSSISGDSGSFLPYLFFIGIIIGIIQNKSQIQSIIASFIVSIVGSIIATIISMIILYYSEGALFTIMLIQSAPIMIIFYIFITIVGGALGYYIAEELKIKNNEQR